MLGEMVEEFRKKFYTQMVKEGLLSPGEVHEAVDAVFTLLQYVVTE